MYVWHLRHPKHLAGLALQLSSVMYLFVVPGQAAAMASKQSKGSQGSGGARAKGSQGSGGTKGSTPMTPSDSARIQAAEAKASGGNVAKGSFAARAQSAAAKNANAGKK